MDKDTATVLQVQTTHRSPLRTREAVEQSQATTLGHANSYQ